MRMLGVLDTSTTLLWAALVSAAVSAALSYLFKRLEKRDTLKAEYEHEQRKRLRELIGRYHGRVYRAALSFDHRMQNLYANHDKGWLDHGHHYKKPGYYLLTTVYRFLALCTLSRKFEDEAIFLDARIAEPADFVFLCYLEALPRVMTDVGLFGQLTYDISYSRDHFFADNLRGHADLCWTDTSFVSLDQFQALILSNRGLDGVFEYFDGLTPEEPRLRWDRLIAFHLLVATFLATFGYPHQQPSVARVQDIIGKAKHPQVLLNLKSWLPELGLDGVTALHPLRLFRGAS